MIHARFGATRAVKLIQLAVGRQASIQQTVACMTQYRRLLVRGNVQKANVVRTPSKRHQRFPVARPIRRP